MSRYIRAPPKTQLGLQHRIRQDCQLKVRNEYHQFQFNCTRGITFFAFYHNFTLSIIFAAKVQIVQYPEVVREVPGTRKDMQCTATGDPPPIITWLKDGTPVNSFNLLVIVTMKTVLYVILFIFP